MTQQDLEARMRRVEDVEAIKQVQYAYAYYIDSKNLDGVMSLFADDVIAEYSHLGKVEPLDIEGLRSFLKGAIAGGWMAHQILMPHIALEGNKAYGMFYLAFFGGPTPDTPPGELRWLQAWYNNEYEKVDGEWKIKHLRLTMGARGSIAGSLLYLPWGPFQFPPPFTYR